MTDHRDVIAAFVDNEPVGADELGEALASTAGREYLIDVLVLRGLVGSGPLVHGATGLQSRGRGRGLWLTAAAAVLVAGVTGGFLAGRGTLTSDGPVNLTPTAAPIVMPAGSGTSAAPAPTHVIRMKKGVDWNERSGGN